MFFYTVFFLLTYQSSKLQRPFGQKSLQWSRAILVAGLMWLLMGFRDQTVAGDTIAYVSDFLNKPIQWLTIGDFLSETREPLFYLLEWLCQKITSSYTVYLFITSLMVAVGFFDLLKNYSDDMFLSVLIFSCIGSMYFCMAGLRQAIAMGVTMLAFRFARERRLLMFSLLCFIAYEFHNSANVFALVYPIVNWSASWKSWLAVIVFAYLGITRNESVMTAANYFTARDYEMAEVGLNHTMFFIQLVFVIFCFVYERVYKKMGVDPDFNSFLLLSFIGLCYQSLTPIRGEFFRVSSYFSVYLCLAVPRVFTWINKEEKGIIYPMMTISILAYIYIFGAAKSYMTCF